MKDLQNMTAEERLELVLAQSEKCAKRRMAKKAVAKDESEIKITFAKWNDRIYVNGIAPDSIKLYIVDSEIGMMCHTKSFYGIDLAQDGQWVRSFYNKFGDKSFAELQAIAK